MKFFLCHIVSIQKINRYISATAVNSMPKRVKTQTGASDQCCPEPVIEKGDHVFIKIHAKPGAKHNSITDIGEEVGIQISAPPVDGAANTELVKYLAKLLGLKKSQVALDKGSKSRNKVIQLSGLNKEEVLKLLTAAAEHT